MGVLFVLLSNTSHMLLGWGCFSQADTGGARALAVIRKVAHCPHTHTLSPTHTEFKLDVCKSSHDKSIFQVFCSVKIE